MKLAKLVALLPGLVLASLLLAAACSGGEPQELTFELEIAEGKLTLDPPVIKVKDGDEVTLKIQTDEGGEFPLHGYDLDVMVMPGKVVGTRAQVIPSSLPLPSSWSGSESLKASPRTVAIPASEI